MKGGYKWQSQSETQVHIAHIAIIIRRGSQSAVSERNLAHLRLLIDFSWINPAEIFRSYELHLRIGGGRNALLLKDVQGNIQNAATIVLWEESHGADKPGIWQSQFTARLRHSTKTHGPTLIAAPKLLERAQGAQNGVVIYAGQQGPALGRKLQMSAGHLEGAK